MLGIGEKFAGCTIKNIRDSQNGRTWLFVRDNHGVFITCSFSDFLSACGSKSEEERFLDQMAEAIYNKFREKEKKIWVST